MKNIQCPVCGVIRELIYETVTEALTHQRGNAFRTQEPQDLLTDTINAEEAAALLHIAKQTLYSLTSRRKIPFYKQGKKILFRRSELVAWLKEGKSEKDGLNMSNSSPAIHYPAKIS